MNPYETLGVSETASDDEIKSAYRKLSKENHPDKKGSTKIMSKINAAYAILKDPKKRKQYDETGSTESVDNSMAKSVGFASQILTQIIETNPDDIYQFLDNKRKQIVAEKDAQIKRINTDIEKALHFKARIIKIPDNPVLLQIVENGIANANEMKKAIESEFDIRIAGLDLFNDFAFTVEESLDHGLNMSKSFKASDEWVKMSRYGDI